MSLSGLAQAGPKLTSATSPGLGDRLTSKAWWSTTVNHGVAIAGDPGLSRNDNWTCLLCLWRAREEERS